MVESRIVLGDKMSKHKIGVNKAKVEVIERLSPLTLVNGNRSILEHVGFYRRFIIDFSKISNPLFDLLKKDSTLDVNEECR